MKTSKPIVSHDELKELLTYDPETGEIRNKVKRGSRAMPDALAGCIKKQGNSLRRIIKLNGVDYSASQIAIYYMTGELPDESEYVIWNKNRDTLDNRYNNLSVIPFSIRSRRNNSRTGVSNHRGVYWSSRNNKWIARIKVDGKSKQLGLFSDIEKAKKARLEGELNYWYK